VSVLSSLEMILHPNSLWVMTGACLLSATAGVLGCYAFLKQRALVGDTLAHAALPGVTTMFLMTGSRSPLMILVGALIGSALGLAMVHLLTSRTIIKQDSALAIVLSFFFAIGVFQLTIIQKIGSARQAGLDRLLFGQASALVPVDVQILAGLALCVAVPLIVAYHRFQMVAFDPIFARVAGISTVLYEGVMSLMIMVAVILGIQLVGVVLVAALMITPAAAARYWTQRLSSMLLLAGIFAGVSGVSGALISMGGAQMPTGPWMVVVITFFFLVSVLGAPERGVISRWLRHIRLRQRIAEENIIRSVFKDAERNLTELVSESALVRFRTFSPIRLERVLRRLHQRGFIDRRDGGIRLTERGVERAEQVTRKHRLWELYLTTHTAIDPEHAHLDAEEIEHLLTHELEQQIELEIKGAAIDPHGRPIPSRQQ
jgi:manganese/zinc/iron transport system permease protein